MHSSECLFTDSYLLRRFQGHIIKSILLQMFSREGKEDVNVSNVHGHLLCDPSLTAFFFTYLRVALVTFVPLHFISCQKVVRMNIEDHLGNVLFFFFPHELVDSVALLKVAMV